MKLKGAKKVGYKAPIVDAVKDRSPHKAMNPPRASTGGFRKSKGLESALKQGPAE